MSGAQAFNNFYDSLKKVREYHQRNNPKAMVTDLITDTDIKVSFSGDEVYGMLQYSHCEFDNFLSRQVF